MAGQGHQTEGVLSSGKVDDGVESVFTQGTSDLDLGTVSQVAAISPNRGKGGLFMRTVSVDDTHLEIRGAQGKAGEVEPGSATLDFDLDRKSLRQTFGEVQVK